MKLRGAVGCFLSMFAIAQAVPSSETVVLLHGLGRTRWSMMRLAHALEAEGYRVVNLTYPSRRQPIETLATEWLPARWRDATAAAPERVHFVTHSMGGILVRLWLQRCGTPEKLGRVVMLAPPNAGSEIPDRFGGLAPFRWFTGVNGRRLGTAPDALPRLLGAWPATAGDLGIIAGRYDGKVRVAATHLAGQRDHLVLPATHTWLMWRRDAIGQVRTFLREGRFAD